MDLSHYAKFLSRLPVFKGLNEQEIGEIASTFKPMTLRHHEVICMEGGAGNSMFIAETGKIEVRKKTDQGDEQVLSVLEAPTVVGEMALLDGSPRSATLVAVGNVSLYIISKADFDRLRLGFSSAVYKVIHNLALLLCERLRETNDKLNEFYADPEGSLALMQKRQKELWVMRQTQRSKEST